MPDSSQPIGVFDSGIGGLSILRSLLSQLPAERFVYYADTAHNPYGGKGDAFVIERSLAITQQLVDAHRIKLLVVACNTATAAAIAVLRERYPQLPIVGVEPALKPAAALTQTRRVAVLATLGTLQSAKFAALKAGLEAQTQTEFICVPCIGLAEKIEHLAQQGERVTTDLIAACAQYTGAAGPFGHEKGQADTLVLGCTHYPLVRDVFEEQIAARWGAGITIVDNATPIAQRTAKLLQGMQAPSPGTRAAQSRLEAVQWLSSSDAQALIHTAQFWLG